MNTQDFWFRMKIANTVLEVLSALVFLLVAYATYVLTSGDVVAQALAKIAIVIELGYFLTLFMWLYYSLKSVEIDAKPFAERSDSDKQTQFFVDKLGMVKLLVATLGLVMLLAAIGYGL